MPWCPRCGAEFRAGFTACNTCHVKLIDHKPDGSEPVEELPPPPGGWEDSPKKQRVLRILRALVTLLLALAAVLLLQNR